MSSIRGIKILVYAMGITLIFGSISLVWLIATKVSGPTTACADGPITVPPNLHPVAMDVTGSQVRLLTQEADGSHQLLTLPCVKKP